MDFLYKIRIELRWLNKCMSYSWICQSPSLSIELYFIITAVICSYVVSLFEFRTLPDLLFEKSVTDGAGSKPHLMVSQTIHVYKTACHYQGESYKRANATTWYGYARRRSVAAAYPQVLNTGRRQEPYINPCLIRKILTIAKRSHKNAHSSVTWSIHSTLFIVCCKKKKKKTGIRKRAYSNRTN